MFTVEKIRPALERALGTCDETEILERVNAAVEILCTESLYDPTRGFVDICVGCKNTITLPEEVETILAVNIGGRPAQGHDSWWSFHLNGPGLDCRTTCEFDWIDGAMWPVYTDPTEFFQVVSFLTTAEDNNVPLRVYGYDSAGLWITSTENGQTVDGFLVPTTYGSSVPNPDAPLLSRITRVSKGVSKGYVRLSTLDYDVVTGGGALLGLYRPRETEPQYRRITLSRTCTWARIAYKRKIFELYDFSDLIPLHSSRAVVLMCQALAKFDKDLIKEGQEYWSTAVRLLDKKQRSVSPPSGPSIQIASRNLIVDKNDRLE